VFVGFARSGLTCLRALSTDGGVIAAVTSGNISFGIKDLRALKVARGGKFFKPVHRQCCRAIERVVWRDRARIGANPNVAQRNRAADVASAQIDRYFVQNEVRQGVSVVPRRVSAPRHDSCLCSG
jgi:hypothetical protein